MVINAQELQKFTGGQWMGRVPSDDLHIEAVSTDTRTLVKNSAFFALKGLNFDAHDFLETALKSQACVLVVDNPKKVSPDILKSAYVLRVDDTLSAYGDLAQSYRKKFSVPVVCVTGSCGKTTVKEVLSHILSSKLATLRNRGTENNFVGAPKTLLQLNQDHQALVLEIGTNAPGEILRLSQIAAPDIGILTHIGSSHLQGLSDIEGVKKEKLQMLYGLKKGGTLILNADDPMLTDVGSGVHNVLRVGQRPDADMRVTGSWCHEKGSSFTLSGWGQDSSESVIFETELLGRHNVLNCALALACARLLGLDAATCKNALVSFKPVPGRMVTRCVGGVIFLDDSYNSNPSSLKAALEYLKEQKIREKKIAVIADMLELGASSEQHHRQAGAWIASLLPDLVIAVGPQCLHLVDEAVQKGYNKEHIYHCQSATQAAKLLQRMARSGDRVLVKGSRGMKMEEVIECFTTCCTP